MSDISKVLSGSVVRPTDTGEHPAIVRTITLEGLAEGFKVRRHAVGMSQMEVDQIAGLTTDYTHKIEAHKRGLGKISIPLLCQVLNCEIWLMPSTASHRDKKAISTLYSHIPKINRLSSAGAKGGRATMANRSPKKKRQLAQAAARARWGTRRGQQ